MYQNEIPAYHYVYENNVIHVYMNILSGFLVCDTYDVFRACGLDVKKEVIDDIATKYPRSRKSFLSELAKKVNITKEEMVEIDKEYNYVLDKILCYYDPMSIFMKDRMAFMINNDITFLN